MAQADVCLHPDQLRHGVTWNWSQAMRCVANERDSSDWHVVVQDDMVALSDWKHHISEACRYSPSPVLGLMWVGERWKRGVDKGVPYVTGPNTLRGGAVAYSSDLFPALADFSERVARTDYGMDDLATAMWIKEARGELPSVVSRSIFASPPVKSLLGHYSKYQTAIYTIEDSNQAWSWSDHPRSIEVKEDAEIRRERQVLDRALDGRWT